MSAVNKQLFDQVTAAVGATSEWKAVGQLEDPSIHIVGLAAGDTVDIEGSNEPTPTAGNAVQLGQVSDSDDLVTITEGPNWVRLNVTADGGGGTLDAWLAGFRRET